MNLDILEKKLNIANELIDELNIEDIVTSDIVPVLNHEIVPLKEDHQFEVFSLETLKNDFIIIRQNVMKLINSGQRILETASLLDVSDLKSSQIMAISNLQKTLGENLKSLIDIYKQVVEIERMRIKEKPTEQQGTNLINSGTVVNNQILFNGSTESLLSFIKENQNI